MRFTTTVREGLVHYGFQDDRVFAWNPDTQVLWVGTIGLSATPRSKVAPFTPYVRWQSTMKVGDKQDHYIWSVLNALGVDTLKVSGWYSE